MPLTPGQSLTHYQILGSLGAGGMGEVYRARDTRLEREVAIKVLPEELADDEERLKRFEREAKTLASLNHTHIAGIHGVDQVGSVCFLALELVPGEDLATRLARGALPLREALDVCRQIAEGLEVAHEAGVVHRDLKPANVRITPEGVVKLLDFGLAKPIRPEGSRGGPPIAESDSFLVTSEGMVLGTPTYMSPEQARGKPVDRRTDIWAFGCVLYECLTGRRAFEGEAFGDLIAAILVHEVDLDALPAATPLRVRRLLERTLARDPRARLRDMGEARIALEDVLAGRGEAEPVPVPAAPAAPRARLPWTLAALGIALAAASLFGQRFLAEVPARPAAQRQLRFTIRHPSEAHAVVYNPVVAHDGSYVAYIASEGNVARLWVRELAAREPRALPGTEGVNSLFLSPDDRFVGFYAGNKLKKVAVSGGTPVEIGDMTSNPGAAWRADGTILFSPSWTSGVASVRVEGGPAKELTTPSVEEGETGHWWPTPLPGGGAVLYTVFTVDGTLNKARIELFDPETGQSRFVAEGAQPLPLSSGHLLYFRAGVYELAPFDAAVGKLTGTPTTVLDELPPLSPAGSTQRFVSVSESGVMAYVARNNFVDSAPRSWFWLDRSGALEPLALPAETLSGPALSPDGRLLAIMRRVGGEIDIFVHDLEGGTETRLTTESINNAPQWSPDGQRLFYNTLTLGTYDVFEADPGGARPPKPLYTGKGDVFVGGLTPDGATMIVQVSGEESGEDLLTYDLESGRLEPFVATAGDEQDARISPDGQLVAYKSDVSGTDHIYVLPLSGTSAPVKVSRTGGVDASWTAGGTRLAFHDGVQILLVDVSIEEDRVRVGRPVPFVRDGLPEDLAQRFTGNYSLSPDGERMIVGLLDKPVRAEIEVVLDGFAALGAR